MGNQLTLFGFDSRNLLDMLNVSSFTDKSCWQINLTSCLAEHISQLTLAFEQAPGEPRLLCSPNSSVSRSPKFFSVFAGSLFAG